MTWPSGPTIFDGEEAIDAAAGAEVEDGLAGLEGGDGGGVAAAEGDVGDGSGEVVDAGIGVHLGDANDLDRAVGVVGAAATRGFGFVGATTGGRGRRRAATAAGVGEGQQFDGFEDGAHAVAVGSGDLLADVLVGGGGHGGTPSHRIFTMAWVLSYNYDVAAVNGRLRQNGNGTA